MEGQQPLSKLPSDLNYSALLGKLHSFFVNHPHRSINLTSVDSVSLNKAISHDQIESLWYHAHKQCEDELLLLYPTHEAAPSLLSDTLSNFPGVDSKMLTALSVLEPFLTAMTPRNLNERFHNGISGQLSLNSLGEVVTMRLKLSAQPLLTVDPLLNLPSESGFRAFDIFYYFLYSQLDDSKHAELLSLKACPADYRFLKKSGTYYLPEWALFIEDHAQANDWATAANAVLPKSFIRYLMTTLSGILLLGNKDANDIAEGAALVGLKFESSSEYEAEELAKAAYVSLIVSVETMVNKYLASLDLHAQGNASDSICSVVTILELNCIEAHQSAVLRSKFDNNFGMNLELVQDGMELPKVPSAVSKQILNLKTNVDSDISHVRNFRGLLDISAPWFNDNHLADFLDIDRLMISNRIWTVLGIATSNNSECLVDSSVWDSNFVSLQIRNLFLVNWIDRSKSLDYTADYEISDFLRSFSSILPEDIHKLELASWAEIRYSAAHFFQGYQRVYLSEEVWQELNAEMNGEKFGRSLDSLSPISYRLGKGFSSDFYTQSIGSQLPPPASASQVPGQVSDALAAFQPEYEEGSFLNGDIEDNLIDYKEENRTLLDFKSAEEGQQIEVYGQSLGRKSWVIFVWLTTWWIPSPVLSLVGRMKRRDIRLAWREKVTIFILIALLNCAIIFYMIFLGRLICPNYDKVWNHKELGYHQGTSDFYVAIHGKVYDITKFYSLQHSDNGIKTSAATMLPFAGQDLSDYFPPPLNLACPSLVTTSGFALSYNATRSPYSDGLHTSGPILQPNNDTALHQSSWYNDVFRPKIQQYYKGNIVETSSDIQKAVKDDPSRYFVTINKTIYDVSNYMQTISLYPASEHPTFEKYNFFPKSVSNIFTNYQGQDITEKWNGLDDKTRDAATQCMNNLFRYGEVDFRKSAKCQAANVILLVLAALLTSITLVKFLASIRFGSKPMPTPQDKFIICQVPIYTEGEDDMRLAIDSLTNLKYDNRRKLLVVICDGIITGAGNDRPTPQIVLDVLGVDESRIKPEPVAYHAIAEGSRELNFAKVYSGLYEHNGDMVPYICIIKVGAADEYRPGNRGKRDSQLIIMNFLNRVHYGDPMCPLDLELFHHINNIIGIEPERFEFLLTIDADTKVQPDSLTRLVAACTADKSISAVCGETAIQNEQQSLSTMIQVYEYFISHHLTKAFESLFGSVTCLPGCFSLYRLRTVERCKPLLISSEIIREYSLRHIDTLHKKNLFSLGEDRYLTTLICKHFPKMKTKFVADAKCETEVPDGFSVLLSQRRRWINSTVHNLSELLYLPSVCGFCLFSMRGIVFADLVGTLMLPSVVVYLSYLIYVLASKSQPLPIISIALICSVYGLQALVFILHRRWQHIFWMIVYIAAYPFHSFILPIYSFWNMDNFSWGNTRIVVDESKGRKVVVQDKSDTYDPKSVPFEPWRSYASRKGLPGQERSIQFDPRKGRIELNVFEDGAFGNGKLSSAQSIYQQHPRSIYHDQSLYYTGNDELETKSCNRISDSFVSPFDAGTAAQIRNTIQQVLHSTDLDTMTPQQLRTKVGDLLGAEFTGERALAVDIMIDSELERMDEEALPASSEMDGFDIEEPPSELSGEIDQF